MTLENNEDDISLVDEIHLLFTTLQRFNFNTLSNIPFNDGIFVLFEDGEKYNSYDRIVYVGINQETGSLINSINGIFSGNKNDSLIRKYLGSAILAKKNDPYLRIWNKDSKTTFGLKKLGTFYDKAVEEAMESEISAYLREHFTVACLNIKSAKRREELRDRLVYTLVQEKRKGFPSPEWLGSKHQDLRIAMSGLWQINNELSTGITIEDLDGLHNYCDWEFNDLTLHAAHPQNQVKSNDIWNVETIKKSQELLQLQEYFPQGLTKKYLKILGFSTVETNVLSLLLYEDGYFLSQGIIRNRTGKSKEEIKCGISNLMEKRIISKYSDYNSNGRLVTYYQLNKSLDELYEYLKELGTRILKIIVSCCETILSCNASNNNKEDLIVKLQDLGEIPDISRILVELAIRPISDLEMLDVISFQNPKRLLEYLRNLIQRDWIEAHDTYVKDKNELSERDIFNHHNKLFSLKLALPDIALFYSETKETEISLALDYFSNFKDYVKTGNISNDSLDRHSEAMDLLLADKRYGNSGNKAPNYNLEFYNSIKDVVITHTSLDIKPVVFELKPPHPIRLRVYTYKLSKSKRPDNTIEYKSVLHIPGQKQKEIGLFDFSNVTLVIICGYDSENELFVMWDVLSHQRISNNQNVQVSENALLEASIYGIKSYVRKNNEIVTIVKLDRLLEGIDLHYENYKKRLLEMI